MSGALRHGVLATELTEPARVPAGDGALPLTPAAVETIASADAPTFLAESSAPRVVVDDEALRVERHESRYDEGAPLGLGGMGEVRVTGDRRIGRRVALKRLRADVDSSQARERFLREARVQGQLEHPAIVPVYDLDVDSAGRLYFTMKRVRGATLSAVIEALRIARDEPELGADSADDRGRELAARWGGRRALAAFAQICRAVEYSHSRGVVHRDLKPSNVMLGDFGEIYVLDWGLAKLAEELESPSSDAEPDVSSRMAPITTGSERVMTLGGAVLGTLAYMAPEQLSRPAEVDARADVYSLGAILYELCTLERLRSSEEGHDLMSSVLDRSERRPSERGSSVPPELDALCAAALSHDPEARLPSAGALAEGVERYLDGDRDLEQRRSAALVQTGLARQAASAGDQLEAVRRSLEALALAPELPEARSLLVDQLAVRASALPAAAAAEYAAVEHAERRDGARQGTWGLLGWLATFPLAIAVGVESWPVVLGLAALTSTAAFITWSMWKTGRFGDLRRWVLATLVAAVVALTSSYLGPFVLVPTAAATAGVLFAVSTTPRERWVSTVLLTLGTLAPFAVELLGWVPPAYRFDAEGIHVRARAIALPEYATWGVMAYSAVTFTVLASVFAGGLRDRLRAAERASFAQAWILRQLTRRRAPGAPPPGFE